MPSSPSHCQRKEGKKGSANYASEIVWYLIYLIVLRINSARIVNKATTCWWHIEAYHAVCEFPCCMPFTWYMVMKGKILWLGQKNLGCSQPTAETSCVTQGSRADICPVDDFWAFSEGQTKTICDALLKWSLQKYHYGTANCNKSSG